MVKQKNIILGAILMFALTSLVTEASTSHTRKHVVLKSYKVASTKIHARTKLADNNAYKVEKVNFNMSPSEPSVMSMPSLASAKAMIVNQATGEVLYAKNTEAATPIASVTKLMTAMVMLDAHLPMDEYLTVSDEDIDTLKGTHSRLQVGTTLTRAEFLHLAIMSSENRAASVLGRNYPGGLYAFAQAMNRKATTLGMTHSRFVDPTGLNSDNVSTAEDLVKMVKAAYTYPQIRQVSTSAAQEFAIAGYRNPVEFHNTNVLVRETSDSWTIGLSKTGFINEAGRCLVMQAEIAGQPVIIVLLDSASKNQRIGDAQRVRKWIENGSVIKRVG
jgi:D-alanyl-D-alanine endopeptidase (penicillin-binding protein 7)